MIMRMIVMIMRIMIMIMRIIIMIMRVIMIMRMMATRTIRVMLMISLRMILMRIINKADHHSNYSSKHISSLNPSWSSSSFLFTIMIIAFRRHDYHQTHLIVNCVQVSLHPVELLTLKFKFKTASCMIN